MIPVNHYKTTLPYACLAILCLVLMPEITWAKKAPKDVWQTHEALTNRLSAEWYRMDVVQRDLENIQEILKDIRDFELYPTKTTKLNEEKMVAFDRSIEKTEKKIQQLTNELNVIRQPLSDAIAILREMVVGTPVEDMFTVIEQGDIKRLNELLALKHAIDDLWLEVDGLLIRINTDMGLEPFAADTVFGIENEFFEIIKANLGQQADEYYTKLNSMKNALIARTGETEQKSMYKVEMYQLKNSVTLKNSVNMKRKIVLMKERYKDIITLHELNLLLARINYTLGDYHGVLEIINLIPDEPAFITEKIVYFVQSNYALQHYATLWEWGQTFSFSQIMGANKNLILWLVMESGLALDTNANYSKFAEQYEKGTPYHLYVMHALARAYLKQNEPQIALSILAKALEREPEQLVDKDAFNHIRLTYAQVLFETQDYKNALNHFFEILNRGIDFEEALFGISWCYIKLNMFQKAETTLRKLINQSPQSPRAAEAILVMTKRLVNKAQYEWKKASFLAKEENRIRSTIDNLEKASATTKNKERRKKYKVATGELTTLLKQLTAEKREDIPGIKACYTQATLLCELITKHYETGSFQEISFSVKREKILHQLDSLILAGKEDGKATGTTTVSVARQREEIQTIKNMVEQSYILSAEIQLNEHKWEKELIDWEKMALGEKMKSVKKRALHETDSTKRQELVRLKNELSTRIDSLVEADTSQEASWSTHFITRITQLLTTRLSREDEIYLRYHLGELYYKIENRKFSIAYNTFERNMDIYDSLNALFREGTVLEMPLQPDPPVLQHTKSSREFKKVIALKPTDNFASAAIYSLAWCYNDLVMFDSAMTAMSIVAKEYPTSPYAPQAWLYLGEYFFDNAKLDSATLAYRSVMKYPESEWFDEALYKLAWTQYRLSNPEKAISSFLALVDLGKGEKTGKAMLETESLDYIAISFSESDLTGDKGLSRAVSFCRKLGDDEKATQILHRLAGVYEDQGRYDIAKKSYQTLLDLYPMYENNALVESKLISVTMRGQSLEESNGAKIIFFKKYNRKSDWAKMQSDPTVIARADSVAAFQLYDASVSYHQLALQKNDRPLYDRAIDAYRDYIHTYPKSPVANECHYNLAEILFSTGQYFQAAEEYMAVSKRYPDSKYKETAAWNAIVASQNLLKQEEMGKQ